MKTFNEIENALRDYSWMIKEIQRLKDDLNSINISMTAQYGIEAAMPKSGAISNPVEREVINKERKQKTLQKFEEKIKFIETHSSYITDDRQIAILNCMLDGMSIVAISQHMGFSEKKVYTLKDEIVRKLKENTGNTENTRNTGFTNIAG